MARIVFAWELGEGMGHVVPYVPLLKALRSKGHRLLFALRDLSLSAPYQGHVRSRMFSGSPENVADHQYHQDASDVRPHPAQYRFRQLEDPRRVGRRVAFSL